MSDGVLVACCQRAPHVGEVERNRVQCREAIVDAAGRGAQIVVLTELANSGYVFADPAEARACAEPLDGPTLTEWAALSRQHGLVIVGGLCEDDGACVRNTSVIVDPTGVRAVYRKVHLWDRETLCFEPGSERPPVIQTDYGRIATMVCYDLEFPEWVRLVALAGADLLCAPTNWPREPCPRGERPELVVKVQANASTNRMFIAACDRCGTERGVDWVGGTVIVGPDGYPVAGPVCADEPRTIVAPCDLGQARDKRTSERNDPLADRRPELYA
jgi:predicted amidohydrolase